MSDETITPEQAKAVGYAARIQELEEEVQHLTRALDAAHNKRLRVRHEIGLLGDMLRRVADRLWEADALDRIQHEVDLLGEILDRVADRIL